MNRFYQSTSNFTHFCLSRNLSTSYSLGLEAILNLDNKKSVDIIVANKKGELIKIDVKGIAKKYD